MLALKFLRAQRGLSLTRSFPRSSIRLCHENSKVPEEERVKLHVYEGALRGKLRWVRIFSWTTTSVFIAVQPALISKMMADGVSPAGFALTAGFVTLGICTPLLLHSFARPYVLALRFEPHTKIFECDTYDVFGRTRTMTFTQSDVTFPELQGPLSNLKIKNKSYLIDFNQIQDADAYDCILKYDKPIDLKLKVDTRGDKS
ncbi:transmembrane protein 70 homolog, mitochondrial [Galendromus occidentalis]|uniref:Transmembrane protein 70 homolog, mitochondrial n=1 Tax=Galendromus occidentalis TaxID=34638 RepID=A0AAJ6QUR0_9ACAR|nr:transmembrane protein 70 homolog, mitochondrial [Galendromus occidentalis]